VTIATACTGWINSPVVDDAIYTNCFKEGKTPSIKEQSLKELLGEDHMLGMNCQLLNNYQKT
jgi:hypothetical protein